MIFTKLGTMWNIDIFVIGGGTHIIHNFFTNCEFLYVHTKCDYRNVPGCAVNIWKIYSGVY